MSFAKKLKDKVVGGYEITCSEAFELYGQELEELCESANEIRKYFCSNNFDICTIVNAKSGRCSENCKFCAQSSFHKTEIEKYPLLSPHDIIKQAKYNYERGILRYSIVTSGRTLSDSEISIMCETVEKIIDEIDISICVSFGLLNKEQFIKLKNSGVTRIHNNLETSRRNFPNICTTHTFDDKIKSIKAAQSAGLFVCSGGIMGLLENIEDRIDMAFTLKSLGIKSVPINMLNPIKNTYYENNQILNEDEMRRIVAVYRFILPTASIRLAGGRGLMENKGEKCFLSGANATISGDMLTTSGISIENDLKIIDKLGYKAVLCNE